jgi:hypothetical protein
MWKNNVHKYIKQAGSGFGHFSPIFYKKQEKNLCFSHLCIKVLDFAAFLRSGRFKTGKWAGATPGAKQWANKHLYLQNTLLSLAA